MTPALNVMVVGAGMYVCGTGTEGLGTILPSLCESTRDGLVGRISIAATRPESRGEVLRRTAAVNAELGTRADVEYFPASGAPDPNAFRHALASRPVDCAIVSTPDPSHHPVTRALIDAGVHCLVVKPLAATLAESRDLARHQRDRGVHGAVEFHKRWDEGNLWIRRALGLGNIGKLLYANVEFSQRRTIPLERFRSWAHSTDVFRYLGVHFVDLYYFWTGSRPVSVTAKGIKELLVREGIDTFDAVLARIEWEHPETKARSILQISTNWIDPVSTSAMSEQNVRLVGTNGRIELDQKNRGLRFIPQWGPLRDVNPYFSEFLPDVSGQGVRFGGYGHRSIRQFVEDCGRVRSGEVAPRSLESQRPTFTEALVSASVLEAATRSLANDGETVPVQPADWRMD